MKAEEIKQKKYGLIEVDQSEKDIVIVTMKEKSGHFNIVQIERENIPALVNYITQSLPPLEDKKEIEYWKSKFSECLIENDKCGMSHIKEIEELNILLSAETAKKNRLKLIGEEQYSKGFEAATTKYNAINDKPREAVEFGNFLLNEQYKKRLAFIDSNWYYNSKRIAMDELYLIWKGNKE